MIVDAAVFVIGCTILGIVVGFCLGYIFCWIDQRPGFQEHELPKEAEVIG